MNITASAMPVTLAGNEYQITPLSDQASHAVTQWLRADLMASAGIARNLANERGENGEAIATAIVQAAMQVEWLDNKAAAVVQTKLGIARLLVESLRPTVAGITQSMALRLIKDDHEREMFWQTFLAVNDLQEEIVPEGDDVIDSADEKKNAQRTANEHLHQDLEQAPNPSDGSSEADANAAGDPRC